MENLNKFSWARMWDITVRDITMNRKSYLSKGIIVVATVLGGLVLYLVSCKISGYSETLNEVFGAFSGWYGMVVGAGSLVAASMLLAATKKKSTCIDMLTVPGTKLEKFLSCVLIYIVGYYLLALIALEVSSLFFYPLGWIFGVEGTGSLSYHYLSETIPQVLFPERYATIQGITNSSAFYHAMMAFPLLMSLWTTSFFVLGSAVWRRFTFGLTLACYFTLLVLSSVTIGSILFITMRESYALILVEALSLGFTVFNWLAAYALFSRKQIVDIKK